MVYTKLNHNLSHNDERFIQYDSVTEVKVQQQICRKGANGNHSRQDTGINTKKQTKNILLDYLLAISVPKVKRPSVNGVKET